MRSTLHCAHAQLFSTVCACAAVLYIVRMRSCFLQCVHPQLYSTLYTCAAISYIVRMRSCIILCVYAQLYIFYIVHMRMQLQYLQYTVHCAPAQLYSAICACAANTLCACAGHTLSPETQKKFSTAGRMGVAVRVASTIEDLPDKVRTMYCMHRQAGDLPDNLSDKDGISCTLYNLLYKVRISKTIFCARQEFIRKSSMEG